MNQYNPNIHHRRSIRLKGYDYSQAGLYFITICCQDRICRFGEVKNGEMILNELGEIAHNEWIKLTERFTHFELDVFQIMPNHMHGIILLNDTPVGSGFTPDPKIEGQPNLNKGQPQGIEGQPQGIAPTGIIPTENDNPVRSGFTPDLNNNEKPKGIEGHPQEGQPEGIAPTGNDNPVRSGFTPDLNNNEKPKGIEGQPKGIEGQPRGIAPTEIIPTENDIPVRSGFTPDQNNNIRATERVAPTIGDIIGAYKSLVANGCLKKWKLQWAEVNPAPKMGKLWQRNYWEHIIRDEKSYYHISNYIINNPKKWQADKFYK